MGRRKKNKSFIERVEQKAKEIIESLQKLGDVELTENDRQLIRQLAAATIQLEDTSALANKLQDQINKKVENGAQISGRDVLSLQRAQEAVSNLTKQVISLQEALGITRAQRQKSKEASDFSQIYDKLKRAAKKFAQARTVMVYCDNCNRFIAQVWWASGDHKENYLVAVCPKCGNKVEVKYGSKFEIVPEHLDSIPPWL